MLLYQYTAMTTQRQVTNGTFSANDEAEVIRYLADLNLVPLQIERHSPHSRIFGYLGRDVSFHSTLSGKALVALTRQTQALLAAGLEVEHALNILATTTQDAGEKRLLTQILEDVRAGQSMADALARHPKAFPAGFIAMIRAGEASGTLPCVFERIADMMERTQRIRAEIQAALIYPAFLCFAAALSLGVLLVIVVPNFLPIFEDSGIELPGPTLLVVAISDFVRSNILLICVGLISSVFAVKYFMRNDETKHQLDKVLLAAPIIGELITTLETARFSHTMGALIGGGVPMGRALTFAKQGVGNAVFNHLVARVIDDVNSGTSLAKSLERDNRFPSLALRLWRIGEETGRLHQMFDRVAAMLDDQSSQAMKKFLALLVPMLTVTMGAITAFIVYSILVAVLSINNLAA